MARVLPTDRWPADGRRNADGDAYLGMIIFLGTWAMLFAALFFAYGVVRAQAPSWPPPTENALPRGIPGLNTLILIGSSGLLRWGLGAITRGQPRQLQRALGGTMALGALFLGAQIAVWSAMLDRGLAPSSGIYGSVFFALTGFHALHVLCGLIVLAVLMLKAANGQDLVSQARAARVTALFWDFITVVWVLMYLTIYVL
jgi:cytochrome c oxidase subunit 3